MISAEPFTKITVMTLRSFHVCRISLMKEGVEIILSFPELQKIIGHCFYAILVNVLYFFSNAPSMSYDVYVL